MSDRITLLDLQGTYRRVSNRIYRILEDGYDFAVDDLLIGTLDRDAIIVEAAFFVLVFGQIENRLNVLAARLVGRDEKSRMGVRKAKFGRRLELALPTAEYGATRKEIAGWYELRSDAAHGERLTASYDVGNVFARAFELDTLVNARPEP